MSSQGRQSPQPHRAGAVEGPHQGHSQVPTLCSWGQVEDQSYTVSI